MAVGSLARQPRSSGSGLAAIKSYSLEDIISTGSNLPNRYGLHAVEGWGKTSIFTHFPNVVYMQSRGETGLETLINAGRIKQTAHFPATQTWEEVRGQVRFLIDNEHPFKALALDTINGLERLMHEFVCTRDFNSDWGEKGFAGYGRGPEVALAEWRMFLNDLDDLRAAKQMTVFMLAHTKVKTFKNPMGADFDRYMPDMHEKTWGLTLKWLDATFFGNFEVVVQMAQRTADITKKGKGTGGTARMLYTQRTAAYDAKNRLGLPEEIEMGDSSTEAFANLTAEIKKSKQEATQ